MSPRFLLVTGKLAEPALRRVVAELAPRVNADLSVAVLPITVAALATTEWIARHLRVPTGIERIVIPGLCIGELAVFMTRLGIAADRGPDDLRDLPEYFGQQKGGRPGYGSYDIAILAEINHVARLTHEQILSQARAYWASGADLIDLGCDPGEKSSGIGDMVRRLRDENLRVSIDSFDAGEVGDAVAAGAELILSVNSKNVSSARSWGCEVVAIPDNPATLEALDDTVNALTGWGIPFRIDPIIEPIGFGFAASLGRFLEVRRRYPAAEILMGVGNLTELTDVDSAGVNVILLGFCQELGIRSVLTTEVINWCRSSVRELDLARRLVHYACTEHVLPKKLEPGLIMLRDPKLQKHGEQTLNELAAGVTDPNFRLFAERGQLHVINGQMYLRGTDPFALFSEMSQRCKMKADHAFYLGFEMGKAVTALTLGKNYRQDQELRWGLLDRGRPP
jgi:dihydropteroate synthase-like protein